MITTTAEGSGAGLAAGPLCIDCGENPQPARHDGATGTHHRCDPCARIYLRRRELCRRLSDARWTFAAIPDPERCTQCGSAIPVGCYFFRFGTAADGDTCCPACAEDCGWHATLTAAAPVAPVLASAWIGYNEFDGPLFVVFNIPAAQPAVAASAVYLIGGLARGGLQGAIGAGEPGIQDLSVAVSARSAEGAAVETAGAIACWLTKHAARVEIPRGWYRRVRGIVYDEIGSGPARRLVRES